VPIPPSCSKSRFGGDRHIASPAFLAAIGLRAACLAQPFGEQARLLRSSGGIGFAVLLMLMQLGFERAFFNARSRSFTARRRYFPAAREQVPLRDTRSFSAANSMPPRGLGVASAWPFYAAWFEIFWKNRSTTRAFWSGFSPLTDQPVLAAPEVEGKLAELSDPDTVLVDRRARRFSGWTRVPCNRVEWQKGADCGSFLLAGFRERRTW